MMPSIPPSIIVLDDDCDFDIEKNSVKKATLSPSVNRSIVKKPTSCFSRVSGILLLVAGMITILTYPTTYSPIATVWWSGWMTALATGLGAMPFIWLKELAEYWHGLGNAIAAGMMLAACVTLMAEGGAEDSALSLMIGCVLGVAFIKATKAVLDSQEEASDMLQSLSFNNNSSSKQVLLIMTVMTLHSISEGIGVGVAFGGETGNQRGALISMTLAVHNIPEGLAIALVLIPKGYSVSQAAVWAIISSLPQPIFAVPAYMFVQECIAILPIGLGFAAGAMAFVAIMELIPESVEKTTNRYATGIATTLAFIGMLNLQVVLKGGV